VNLKKVAGLKIKPMLKRKIKGKVVSDKMQKTVVVSVDRFFAHPVYKKRIKVSKRYLAHNEVGAKSGDIVVIEETRPVSKRKAWRVAEILEGGEPKKKEAKVVAKAERVK
jgi:small subunit ribosomal protein S17